MRRIVFGALAGAAMLAGASAAVAQSGYVTYGQPTVQDYRYAQGGHSAVVETRHGAYAATGAYADGRSAYGYGYGGVGYDGGYGQGCHDRCGGHYPPPPPPSCHDRCGGYGQGGYGQGYGQGHSYAYSGGYSYSQTSHWSERRGHWDRYQPRGGHDRGGRYGYSGGHDRRGYYERDGYHDDRPPSGRDHGRRDRYDRGCDCYAVLDDR